MTSVASYQEGIFKSDLVRRVTHWLEGTAHPPVALEIAVDRVAGVRFHRNGTLDGFAIEILPSGALVPSAIETNLVNATAIKSAVSSVCSRLGAKDEDAVLQIVGDGPATLTPAEVNPALAASCPRRSNE